MPSPSLRRGLVCAAIAAAAIPASDAAAQTNPVITDLAPGRAPAVGGVPLTIRGQDFGLAPGGGGVEVNAEGCGVLDWSATQIICRVPAGEGSQAAVRVTTSTGDHAEDNTGFGYEAPVLTAIGPADLSATRGGILTLQGEHFGRTPEVRVGPAQCPLRQAPQDDRLLCQVAPAAPGVVPVIVQAADQSSGSQPLTLLADPVLTELEPLRAPTAGAVPLTIRGNNFGRVQGSGGVEVGGADCPVSQWSNQEVVCTVPPGEGAPVTVRLFTDFEAELEHTTSWGYAAPSVSSLSPTEASTSGGVPLEIVGASFGFTPQVQVGSAPCAIGQRSHTRIVCTLPPGAPGPADVVISVAGQSVSAQGFSYRAPVPSISDLAPAPIPTAGSTPLTLRGQNFGLAPGGSTVQVGGGQCAPRQWSDEQIICDPPPGEPGADAQVRVTVGGLTSPPAALRYAAPQITDLEPQPAPTQGQVPLTIRGQDFGTLAGAVDLGGRDCPVRNWGREAVECTLPEGQGADLELQLTAANGTPASAGVRFSYAAPTISELSPLRAPASGGLTLTLRGENFGTAAQVDVGGNPCPIGPGAQSHVQLECTLPAGVAGAAQVIVDVAGQQASRNDFSYTAPLAITDIAPQRGPTAGAVPLTIQGSDFGVAPGSVQVGGEDCPVNDWADAQVICELPAGSGSPAEVLLTTDAGAQARDDSRFGYAAPQITDLTPSRGPRGGGITLTLQGDNFGTAAQVSVGGNPCQPAAAGQSHVRIECVVPAGDPGPARTEVVVGGQSSNPVFFLYEGGATTPVPASATPGRLALALGLGVLGCAALRRRGRKRR